MNLDLAQLNAMLSGLGPWGIVAAVVITIAAPKIVDWLKGRFPNVKLPTSPSVPLPGPAPAPGPLNPADPLAGRPVLGLALALLQQILARNNPGKNAEELLIGHLLSQLGGQVLVEATPAERMTGPRLADKQ